MFHIRSREPAIYSSLPGQIQRGGYEDGERFPSTREIAGWEQEAFFWEHQKGRARFYDVIATELICTINWGIYPIGSILPAGTAPADVNHVCVVTIRRTIDLLNPLGIVTTVNQ